MTTKTTDVLFAFSDTGGGHRSAAVAINGALAEASGGALTSEMIDVLSISGVPGLRSAPQLYDQLSTRWLALYDLTFQLTNGVRRVDMISRLVAVQARRNVARALQTARPRVVVVTHPLVHRFVCMARRAYRLPFRIVTVVTDLVSIHASWSYPGVDLIMLPTDEAYALMRRRGIRPERLLRTGFPVHPKFAHYNRTRDEARQDLGIAAEPFTVLVTSGGVGSGRLRELVLDLERAYPDKQILVVTGKNRAIYQELQERVRSPYVHIYGFVDNMETLMAASDIVVTKAGPGTLMEALVMRRPVIVTEAVGMQERGNIDFVLNRELGLFCPTNERIISAVDELTDPRFRAETMERLTNAVPRDGAAQIAAIVLEQLGQATVQPLPRRNRRLPPFPGLRRWDQALRRIRGARRFDRR